jgi:hypothetical protein
MASTGPSSVHAARSAAKRGHCHPSTTKRRRGQNPHARARASTTTKSKRAGRGKRPCGERHRQIRTVHRHAKCTTGFARWTEQPYMNDHKHGNHAQPIERCICCTHHDQQDHGTYAGTQRTLTTSTMAQIRRAVANAISKNGDDGRPEGRCRRTKHHPTASKPRVRWRAWHTAELGHRSDGSSQIRAMHCKTERRVVAQNKHMR